MKYLKTLFNKISIYLVIAIFSVIPFWRIGFHGLMERTDADFPLLPIANLKSQLFVWYDRVTMGYDISSAIVSQLPFYSFIAILSKLGLPIGIIERIWFFLGLFVAGISAYFLALHLNRRRSSALLASLLYICNPLTLNLLSQGGHIAILSYGLAPLLLLLSILGIEKKQLRYALLLGLVSIIAAVTNVPNFVMTLLPTILYLFYELITNSNERKYVLKFSIASAANLLIYNLWWLYSGISSLKGSGQIADINRMWLFNWKTISESASYLNSLLVIGIPRAIHGPIVLLAILFIGVIVSALYTFVKQPNGIRKRWMTFSLMLLVFAYIFSIGDKGLWGDVQQLVMMKISPLQMFRNPYRFANIMMLAYCMLLALSYSTIVELCKRFRYYKPIRPVLLGGVLILLASFPILSGNINGYLKPVHIPPEYYQVANYLKEKDGESAVFMLPQEDWLTKFKWAPYDMPDFSRYLFANPIIRDYPENRLANINAVHLMSVTYDVIDHDLDNDVSKFLYMMNARYVLNRKDVEKNTTEIVPSKKLSNSLSNQPNLSLKYSNDYFELYENYLFSKKIYVSNQLFSTDQQVDPKLNCLPKLEKLFSQIDWQKQPVIITDRDNHTDQILDKWSKLDDTKTPDMEYRKISPTRYEVKIRNASTPFLLSFQESFSESWQATIDGVAIPSELHGVGNNYANLWMVEKSGDFTVIIGYTPQDSFNYLLYFEITLVILSIGYLYATKKNKN